MRLFLIPYNRGSASARMLAAALGQRLGYKVWRIPTPRHFSRRERMLNLCWGYKGPITLEFSQTGAFINNPFMVNLASNKLASFNAFNQAGVSHVPYTASAEVAQGWLEEGQTVFARTTGGQGGSGITIVRPDQELPTMPLYTQYVPKEKEFRVHVVRGSVIDVQQKKRRDGAPRGSLIRNLANGWVFCHENVVEPAGLRELGVAAVEALGLDFGAVDIIWNEHRDKCYVLEVNTAPGLCETTCGKYVEAIINAYT